jgi:hypothetical protein
MAIVPFAKVPPRAGGDAGGSLQIVRLGDQSRKRAKRRTRAASSARLAAH